MEKRPLREWLAYNNELFNAQILFEAWVMVEGEVDDSNVLNYLQRSLFIHLKYKELNETPKTNP